MPEARQHSGSLCNFTGHPEAIAEGSQKVDEMLKQVQDDKYVSETHRKNLFPYSPITLFTSKKAAFTLAEVLITLAIIGIVAAMTIPTLVANYQTRAWSTSASVFERKLEEALRQMNTQQVLAGYKSTADFVNALGKYFKINKVCNNNELTSCFTDKITWEVWDIEKDTDSDTIDIATIKTAADLGQEDWNSETVGVQFANGTTGIIAYNPDCRQEPFSNQFTGTSCISLIYDTDGLKKPNSFNKDIRGINSFLHSCVFKIDKTCFSAPFKAMESLSSTDCEKLKDDLGIKECSSPRDYWGGAVRTCGGINKMATDSQIRALAEAIYGTTIKESGRVEGLDMKEEIVDAIGLKNKYAFTILSNEFYIEYTYPLCRAFFPGYTYQCNATRQAEGYYFFCVTN